jgi:hypothetical protein
MDALLGEVDAVVAGEGETSVKTIEALTLGGELDEKPAVIAHVEDDVEKERL